DSGHAGQGNLYGRGIIDADAALTADVDEVSENPMGSIADWIAMHRRGEVDDTDTQGQKHQAAGPVDYPSELPVAAKLANQSTVLQAGVVIGFGIAVVLAFATSIFFWRKRTRTRHGSLLWEKLHKLLSSELRWNTWLLLLIYPPNAVF